MHHGYTRHRSPDTLFSMAGAQVKRIVKDSVRRFKPPPSNSWYPRYFTCSEPSAITRLAVRTLHEYLTSAPHVFKVENALKRSFRLHFIVYTSMFSLFTCSSLVVFPGNSSLYFESIKKVSLMRKELHFVTCLVLADRSSFFLGHHDICNSSCKWKQQQVQVSIRRQARGMHEVGKKWVRDWFHETVAGAL